MLQLVIAEGLSVILIPYHVCCFKTQSYYFIYHSLFLSFEVELILNSDKINEDSKHLSGNYYRKQEEKKEYEVLKKATKLDITEDFTTQKSHRKTVGHTYD
jgi:hypothetical protein